MRDFYSEVRLFAAKLESIGFSESGAKLINAIKGGSTGGEILMGIRWHLQELIREQKTLPDAVKADAEKFIHEINATGI